MKKINYLPVIICWMFSLYSCHTDSLEETEELVPLSSQKTKNLSRTTDFELALRWAPIHYMDVDATGTYAEGGKSDYVTAINYDGDWNAENNWNNLAAYSNSLSAHCYYSIVETNTHWFIIYAFFHPRDWTDNFLLYNLDQHENDLEGIMMAIEKDASTYGTLRGAVTVSHSDFYSYTPAGSTFSNGLEDIDGTLEMQNYNGAMHPVTAQEAKGHGLKAWPQNNINGDGVIYYPSANSNAQIPSDNYDNYVEYKLVNIFETGGLWDQRFNTNLFFDTNGGFKGNDFKTGGANAPWAWNDGDDGIVQGGEMATNPAKLIDNYFDGLGNFSHFYLDNKYNSQAGGVVTFYQHCDFKGYAVALPAGNYTIGQLEAYGIKNDDLSSVRIEDGYRVTIYEHNNFEGNSLILTSNTTCFGNNLNDKTSSVKIAVE
ncbi:hypothetical protein [Abyssalbus ytuae]|uniref:Beta/gamma crystallin 'Greek key' domain-containing protein n=1 Tax=Abyssalbus ytuae TaxID=2926907 RepID=A0A9E7D287_9FLAO|nr:hypothetical protein [Abyssalbus ytuae]UOB17903.1 hypothetical protein MQE35_01070 [Abyssalbus ytuae]